MAATNEQVTHWANERTRIRCEAIRALLLSMEDDNATIGEVYANLNNSPNWTDARVDVPNQLGPNDILAINTFCVNLANLIRNGDTAGSMDDAARAAAVKAMADQLPIVLKGCVRAV